MLDRKSHQQEVQAFLQKHFCCAHWDFALPKGRGHETYFAHSNEHTYFVKLGVEISRYQVIASINLTPQVLVDGCLTDGTTIIVQPYLAGRKPSRKDFQVYLDQFATAIDTVHHNPNLKQILPPVSSEIYRHAGMEALVRLQQRWEYYRGEVPEEAEFVDESLTFLAQQVQRFMGMGLVASHNDICNANWMISSDEQLYLIDLEAMSLDDPAVDIGALLWWYYPPEMRPQFLEIVGYPNDEAFRFRMRVRMAMHCLSITLPREQSFDPFDPAVFNQSLTDFRAIMANRENPQGYGD